ncbi:MAG: UvrD-helicase domain-containing protein, partial [Clostridia bacterium]|nr:UvrD-helicase domain-containing protein [Clostridia bacterium]
MTPLVEKMDLSTLNKEQLEAVHATEGAVLVLAGAGSGKTRVLTYRIANLIEEKGVSPYHILAITFTNKATNEMKERLEKMLGEGSGVWVSTFHSLCARILRYDADKLGYDKNYTIYSDTDSERVIKRIVQNKHIEKEGFDHKVAEHISNAKTYLFSPEDYRKECGDRDAMLICDVYEAYEEELRNANAMDYDDLLIKTYELFSDYPEVLKKYAERFHYIHIDEYQDTSRLQYKIAAMLSSVHGNLFVVGDEDQSIYGWRGADISNILDFRKDFPNATVIKLEQNYRSTTNILNAANAVISHNSERFEKKLWSEGDKGVRVETYTAQDDREEAEFVARQISSLIRERGMSPSDFAILVRINALTRKLEEKLRYFRIPYKMYGGFKFYERKEVKSLLAYFRAFVNPRDNDAFLRIINTPKRGIGDSVTDELSFLASERGISVSDVLFGDMTALGLSDKSAKKLRIFKELFDKMVAARNEKGLGDFAEYVATEAGFFLAYAGDKEEDLSHRENLNQLIGEIREFEKANQGATLEEYLQSVALISDTDEIQTDEYVTVSTVHSVKGLEFNVVFVMGLEENVFPSQSYGKSTSEIEEERRVMYVAMTRAKRRLFLTSARSRFMYGRT